MDTINSIENKLSALTNHLHNNNKKFDDLMQFLRTSNAGGQASSTISQNGTSEASNINTGEDIISISNSMQ
jgi:hypothetical protein